MSEKHTLGPWYWVDPETDMSWQGGPYASLRTVNKFGKSETVERDGQHYTSFALPVFVLDATDISNPADARLIAAAPDLLEALRGVLAVMPVLPANHGIEGMEARYNFAVVNARAAIATATKEKS